MIGWVVCCCVQRDANDCAFAYSGVVAPRRDEPNTATQAKEQLLATFEQMYVTTLLDRHRGNVTKAAAAAGLSRKHLHDLMKKIELTSTDPDE